MAWQFLLHIHTQHTTMMLIILFPELYAHQGPVTGITQHFIPTVERYRSVFQMRVSGRGAADAAPPGRCWANTFICTKSLI